MSSLSERAETQLRLIEEEERLIQLQSKEKERMITEKIRCLEERENLQKQMVEEMENRHKSQKELLSKKSALLKTLNGSQKGSSTDSDVSSVNGSEAALVASTSKVNNWKATFDIGILNNRNKESTNIYQHRNPADSGQLNVPRDKVLFQTPQENAQKNNDVQTIISQTATIPPPNPIRDLAPVARAPPELSTQDMNQTARLWNSSYFGSKDVYDLPKFDGTAEQ